MDRVVILLTVILIGCIVAGSGQCEDYNSVAQRAIGSSPVKLIESSAFLLDGFKTFEVIEEDKKTGRIFHEYIWISNDKKYVIPILIDTSGSAPQEIKPEKEVEYIPVDVQWFKDEIEKLPPCFKKSIGEGEINVYLLADPFCPPCKRLLKKAIPLAEANRIRLYVFPLPLLKEESLEASILFIEKEGTEGLKKALRRIKLAAPEDIYRELGKSEERKERLEERYGEYIEGMKSAFRKKGFRSAPITFIFKSKDKAEIRTGYFDIKSSLGK